MTGVVAADELHADAVPAREPPTGARHEHGGLLGAAVQPREFDRGLMPMHVGHRRHRAHAALDVQRVDDLEPFERLEVAPLVGIRLAARRA